ncbi:MAG TPA: DUF4349 domain-containing protein [Verrucomicrobiae bacterium]|nr:DUF4349 domain-containing protein [Verrucomicrobiae bacterium]
MPTPTQSRTKQIIGGVIIVSAILIALVLAGIWLGTSSLFHMAPAPIMQWVGNAGTDTGMPGATVARDDAYAYGEAGTVSKGMMPPVAPMPTGAGPDDRANIGTKIVRDGSLTMRVDDAAKRLEDVRGIVENAKGFVASANVTDNAGVKTAYATVRVPNDQYDAVRTAIKALASTVFVESENSEDVTAQYVDLNARLTAAQAEEQQYLEILKKSGTIEDTLAVTQQLSQVRTQIEQLQGQLRYMNDQTSYATLTLTLTEEAKIQAPTRVWKPGETFNQAIQALVVALQNLADAFITAGVFILGLLVPVILVLWVAAWIVYRLVKTIAKRK